MTNRPRSALLPLVVLRPGASMGGRWRPPARGSNWWHGAAAGMIDHAWLDWLKSILEVVRWPLTVTLVAICVFFWRRGPEKNEPWRPTTPADDPVVQTDGDD